MKKNCKDCGAEFDGPDDPVLSRFIIACSRCNAVHEAGFKREREEREHREREQRWRELCPAAYHDTAMDKLPDPARVAEILAWNYGPTGLLLYGRTRRGKTRCAWLLVRKVFDSHKSIRTLDSLAGFEYGALFATNAREAGDWVYERCRCGLLFMDDVFKVKLTDSFESAVFAIVDYRLAHRLPIVATLNDTGETLSARMSKDRGEALVARLKEMCEVIKF